MNLVTFYAHNVIDSNKHIFMTLCSQEPTLKVSMKPTPSTFHSQIFSRLKHVTLRIRYL